MATDTYAPPDERTVTSLVSGIVNDAQTLIQQQLALLRGAHWANIFSSA